MKLGNQNLYQNIELHTPMTKLVSKYTDIAHVENRIFFQAYQ